MDFIIVLSAGQKKMRRLKSFDKSFVEEEEGEITRKRDNIIDVQGAPESCSLTLPDGLTISVSSVKFDVLKLKKICFDILEQLNHKDKNTKERGYYG